jgi:hypothetical protein
MDIAVFPLMKAMEARTGTWIAGHGMHRGMTVMSSRASVNGTLVAALVACVVLGGCFGQSDSDRIGEVQSDLVLLVEGKSTTNLVRHCPDELSDMEITMESGRYEMIPDSLDELEEYLDEFREPFNGEDIDLTQENVEITDGTARASMTFRVSDEGWERLLPVRLDLERHGERWVLVGLHLFD